MEPFSNSKSAGKWDQGTKNGKPTAKTHGKSPAPHPFRFFLRNGLDSTNFTLAAFLIPIP